MNGYLFVEEKGGYKYLIHLTDRTPDKVGLYPFLVVLSWDRAKHVGGNVEFSRIMWFPSETPIKDFKLYLPLEWYCSIAKQQGICDIECLTVKGVPKIRKALVGKSRLRRSGSYFVRLAVRKAVNPNNWKLENLTKKKEITFDEAKRLYSLFHYAKGEWKNDLVRVKKINNN